MKLLQELVDSFAVAVMNEQRSKSHEVFIENMKAALRDLLIRAHHEARVYQLCECAETAKSEIGNWDDGPSALDHLAAQFRNDAIELAKEQGLTVPSSRSVEALA